MKLTLIATPWKGDRPADTETASVLLVRGTLINDQPVLFMGDAHLQWTDDLAFLTLTLRRPSDGTFARFAPEECVSSSIDALVLPISHVELRDYDEDAAALLEPMTPDAPVAATVP
jgi:hypothetical protein